MQKLSSSRWLELLAIVLAFLAWIFGWHMASAGLLMGLAIEKISQAITFSRNVRFALLLGTQPPTPRETDLAEWPQVDNTEWEKIAQEWRKLGFNLCDTKVFGEALPELGIEVSQVWICSEMAAVVQISQSFLPKQTKHDSPVTTTVISYWGDACATIEMASQPEISATKRLPTYSYGVSNKLFNWIFNALQHPQVMGRTMDGATPLELWNVYLERRESVSRALKMDPIADDLQRLSEAHGDLIRAMWHRRSQRGFMLRLLRARLSGDVPTENWGELESRIRALPV